MQQDREVLTCSDEEVNAARLRGFTTCVRLASGQHSTVCVDICLITYTQPPGRERLALRQWHMINSCIDAVIVY